MIEDSLIDFQRDPSRKYAIIDAAQDLEDHYINEGYADARVASRIEREPKLRVVFEITEGPRVIVESIAIDGNASIEDESLLELWQRSHSGVLGLGEVLFVRADLLVFASSIRAKYEGAGFLDVRVDKPRIERGDGRAKARVRYNVREGRRYRIEAAELDPRLLTASADFDRLKLGSYVGRPAESLVLRSLALEARRLLEDAGYPEPSVRLDAQVDRRRKRVRARVVGKPGKRRRVARVDFSGHERTAVSVMQSRLTFRVGEWFSAAKVDESIQRLYETALFSKASIERSVDERGDLTLRVVVKEVDAKQVSFLLGWGELRARPRRGLLQ